MLFTVAGDKRPLEPYHFLKLATTAVMADNTDDRKELKAQWKTDEEVPVMTLNEVKGHNVKKDLWIVIHGKGSAGHHPCIGASC